MPKSTCSFESCNLSHYGKGLCEGHYHQVRRGQELRPLARWSSEAERFWAKVNKSESCWEWRASLTRGGYGQFYYQGSVRRAHRVAWMLTYGEIPEGKHLDHKCHNPACVNPSHLRPVTIAQNMQHRKGPTKSSKSNIRNVYWMPDRKKWQVSVGCNGKTWYGGYFDSVEEAEETAIMLRSQLFSKGSR